MLLAAKQQCTTRESEDGRSGLGNGHDAGDDADVVDPDAVVAAAAIGSRGFARLPSGLPNVSDCQLPTAMKRKTQSTAVPLPLPVRVCTSNDVALTETTDATTLLPRVFADVATTVGAPE